MVVGDEPINYGLIFVHIDHKIGGNSKNNIKIAQFYGFYILTNNATKCII